MSPEMLGNVGGLHAGQTFKLIPVGNDVGSVDFMGFQVKGLDPKLKKPPLSGRLRCSQALVRRSLEVDQTAELHELHAR